VTEVPKINEHTVPDKRAPWRTMFNTEAFAALRGQVPTYQDLVFEGVKIGEIAAVDGVNGWSAPYGDLDFRRDYWRPEMIHGAICDHDFGDLTEIRCAPNVLSKNSAAAANALFCAGWQIAGVDINHTIPMISMDAWVQMLPRQTVHSINRATDAGCGHALALSDNAWRDCYDLLDANRRAKGRVLSLDFDYVLALREAFGDLIRMHALFDGDDRLVAAALVYRVAKAVDMVQWHGDLPEHGLGYSPMPAIVAAYMLDAEATGANFVDIGISSVHGVPDGGLCRAKRGWGAIACQRVILRR
jgi:hypothetical protein